MNTVNTNNEPLALEFKNVSVSFDGLRALDDVSFTLAAGEMIFLTGISGSGKSVLLHLAMGLQKPDSGHILVFGKDIVSLDETELVELRGGLMGLVFQEDSLFTGMDVYENAAYRLEEHGWSDEKTRKAVSEVLRFVGLKGEEEKLPAELSGGMKRRLEIARALIGWPRIMLFDEPTMSLDPIVAKQVLDLMIRARDINNISSIYVTKKTYEIPYLAGYRAATMPDGEIVINKAPLDQLPPTRVMVVDGGRIIFKGSAEQFEKSKLPAIRELISLEHHDHAEDPYFIDPWDKRRRPKESIL